jgi:hypothetical protein
MQPFLAFSADNIANPVKTGNKTLYSRKQVLGDIRATHNIEVYVLYSRVQKPDVSHRGSTLCPRLRLEKEALRAVVLRQYISIQNPGASVSHWQLSLPIIQKKKQPPFCLLSSGANGHVTL